MRASNIAGAAVRAHDESEAERISRIVGAELKLPESAAELELFRKGDPRKVPCGALVKDHTSVKNEWLANRLRMGHPAAMSQLVNWALKNLTSVKIVKQYKKTFKSKD